MMLDSFVNLGLIDANGQFDTAAASAWHHKLQQLWNDLNVGTVDEDGYSELFSDSAMLKGEVIGSDDSDAQRRRQILTKLRYIFDHRNDASNSKLLTTMLTSNSSDWPGWSLETLQHLLNYCRMLSVDATVYQLFKQADRELKRLNNIFQFTKEIEQQDQKINKQRKLDLDQAILDAKRLSEKMYYWLNRGVQRIALFTYYYDSVDGYLRLHINPEFAKYDIRSQELANSIKELPIVNGCKISIDNYDELSAEQGLAFSMVIFRAGHDLVEGDLYRYDIKQENTTARNLASIFEHKSALAGTVDWVQSVALSRLVDTVLARVPAFSAKIASARELKNSHKLVELRSYGLDLGSLSMMFDDKLCVELSGNDDKIASNNGRTVILELLQLYQRRTDCNLLLNKIADHLHLSLEVPAERQTVERLLLEFEKQRRNNIKQYSSQNCRFADLAVNSQVPLLHNAYRMRDMAKYSLLSNERKKSWLQQLANYYSEPEIEQFNKDFISYQHHLNSGARLWNQLKLKPDLETVRVMHRLSERLERYSLAPDLFDAEYQRGLFNELLQLGLPVSENGVMHEQLLNCSTQVKQLLIYGNQEVQVRYSQSMRESFGEFYRASIREHQNELRLHDLIADYSRLTTGATPENSPVYRELVEELQGVCYAIRHVTSSETSPQHYLQRLLVNEKCPEELRVKLLKIAERENVMSLDLSMEHTSAGLAMTR